jgi:branched-subunit amino acid ABC-type transport system permease component
VNLSLPRLISFGVLIVISIALFAFLKYTTTGKQIRAVSQNPVGAEVVGINARRIYLLTYGLGTALAGVAGALLTGLGVYDKLAKIAGAGTLVPITGFANSVAAPALEFKAEGFVTGMAVKMFSIAGPVIVFGTAAGVVYGLVLWVLNII